MNTIRSLTHWTAWPATGRCVIQTSPITDHVPASICTEPDVDLQLHAGSTHIEDDLSDASSPGGLSSGRSPARVLTARRSASYARADSCRRRTRMQTSWFISLSQILLQMSRCWVWFITDASVTKSRISKSLYMYDVLKASSFYSSNFVRAQVFAHL